jgi:hypothetical protein
MVTGLGIQSGGETNKIALSGKVISVQPRIRLTRSFDQRSHTYLGYNLTIEGIVGREDRTFTVGIGKGAQAKHQFKAGDIATGSSEVVHDLRSEVVEYYKASELKVVASITEPQGPSPPWQGTPPELEVYRQRGHRRLDPRTYGVKCKTCIWGCQMPVEMIIDHWNPSKKKYRYETFCYGPKSCPIYKAGPTRKVPGRKGMVWEEEDWVDEDAVSHRGKDE